MIIRKLLGAAAVATFIAGSALAQTATQPAAPAKPAAAAPAAATPAKPTTTGTVTQKVNLNTASATDLDKLPQIGEARAKAIVEARAKGKFKDWNDFVARSVVPKNAEDAIKDKVSF